jgi:hypothetical protein
VTGNSLAAQSLVPERRHRCPETRLAAPSGGYMHARMWNCKQAPMCPGDVIEVAADT